MVLLFRPRAASDGREDAAVELVAHARALLGADDDTVVSIREHACGDPECGTRTALLVTRPYRPTAAVKFDKPLAAVTRADVAAALAPLVARPDSSEKPPKRRRARSSAMTGAPNGSHSQ
jgi:hypothetical protein